MKSLQNYIFENDGSEILERIREAAFGVKDFFKKFCSANGFFSGPELVYGDKPALVFNERTREDELNLIITDNFGKITASLKKTGETSKASADVKVDVDGIVADPVAGLQALLDECLTKLKK